MTVSQRALLAACLRELRDSNPEALATEIRKSSRDEQDYIACLWELWGRPSQQIPEGDWITWLILAGRGFGKTRTGAETIRSWQRMGFGRFALIGETAADARDVMVEGESGILSIYPKDQRPKYEPSKRRLTWPNGAIATTYSAEDPDQLRGPQQEKFWGDEPAKWKYPDETYSNLLFGLRLGERPQGVLTGTPRPTKFIKGLLEAAKTGRVVVTRASTFENIRNLSGAFRSVIEKYEGTRVGRQELEAEVLEDVEGALWTLRRIDELRVAATPELIRVYVGVDPAVTATEESDETGIVVAGEGWCTCKRDEAGQPKREKHYFVLADCSVGVAAPPVWAARACNAYHDHKADRVIAEVNNGGDMVRTVIRQAGGKIPVQMVHATRGKITRAEPVSMLYEQGKVHHAGVFPELEDQMTTYVPGDGDSPDRMDALVWAISTLNRGGGVA